MAQKTVIAWTEHTWNPWRGCTKVSPGCRFCYMFTAQERYGRDPSIVLRTQTWRDPAKWQSAAVRRRRNRELVFTCSWSDWFHPSADPWRPEAWEVIRACPNLDFQILTKRPERIRFHLPADWGQGWPNVWLGVSVESQQYLERVDLLAATPAAIRFVSAEPLLGPLDLRPWLSEGHLDWVIVGGESGGHIPQHPERCMDLDWARDLRQQCREYAVAYFFKQSSGVRTEMGRELDGALVREYPLVRRPPQAD